MSSHMKTCNDLPELPDMPCCCQECHEDGVVWNMDRVIEYQGEKYSVCCMVGEFMSKQPPSSSG